MNAVHAEVEALASVGLWGNPKFNWNATCLSMKDAVDSLAINVLSMPSDVTHVVATTGLGKTLQTASKRIDRNHLPYRKVRRLAVTAMHVGSAMADVAKALGPSSFEEDRIAQMIQMSYHDKDPSGMPLLQHVLTACVCASQISPKEHSKLFQACRSVIAANSLNAQTLALMQTVINAAATATETYQFTAIAEQILPDVGEEMTDQEPPESDHDESTEGSGDAQSSGGIVDKQEESGCESTHPSGSLPAKSDQPSTEAPETSKSKHETATDLEVQSEGLIPDAEKVASNETHQAIGDCGAGMEAVKQTVGMLGDLSVGEQSSFIGHESAKCAGLVTEIVRSLQSQDQRTTKVSDRGKRVVASSLWRMKALGDARVFREKTTVAGSSIAVDILLDGSYSMRKDLAVACQIALCFCDALQRLSKATAAFSIFRGRDGVADQLLEFGEPVASAKRKLQQATAQGGTPAALAIAQRRVKLAAMRKTRQVMVIITDGYADNSTAASEEVAKCNAQGIEVIGIGIGQHGGAIRNYLPHALCVKDIPELQYAMGRAFTRK